MAANLNTYRAKRRFAETPEPAGGAGGPDAPLYVIQKHHARRMHYDLRLEMGGTLKSWAVPEGPCLDPKVRRFAKLVEDHPIEYASFEGRIPAGNYGAGTVIVWDRGTYVTLDDPEALLAKGEIKFRLAGEKLTGGWMLKRLPDDPTNWLLIKERDPSARPLAEYDVLEEEPNSVVTGRPVDEEPVVRAAVATQGGGEDRRRGRPADAGAMEAAARHAGRGGAAGQGLAARDQVRRLPHAGLLRRRPGAADHPQRPRLDQPLRGAGQGVREAAVQDAPSSTARWWCRTRAASPRSICWSRRCPTATSHAMTYFAFDLCYLDGYDLSAARLVDRKAALHGLIDPLIDERSPVQFSEHIEGDGDALFAQASRMGLEGIVSKKADARYVQARSAELGEGQARRRRRPS